MKFLFQGRLVTITIILFQLFLGMVNASVTPRKLTIPGIYFFGDSIVDSGNNNFLVTVNRGNFHPYGMDFKGKGTNGRFSNGMIIDDFLASSLGIKELVPPYLDNKLSKEDLLTGVCFASAGTGYDPDTPSITGVLSMPKQVVLFKEYKNRIKDIIGENNTTNHLQNSMFIVCSGTNDAVMYFYNPLKSLKMSIIQYAEFLKEKARIFIEDLIKFGARKIGILGIPPLGCVPFVRNVFGGQEKKCGDAYNELAMIYNRKLNAEIINLNSKYNRTKVFHIDLFYELLDIVKEPKKYGFEVAVKGCCGTGIFEVSLLCNGHSKICSNTSSYLFFDSFHPSERASKILAQKIIKKYSKNFV